VPEEKVMPIPIGVLLFSGANIGGSAIGEYHVSHVQFSSSSHFFKGGTDQIARMLKLAAEKKPKFFIEKRKMSDANQAIVDMAAGKPRFRYCLVNEGVEE
jgi:alcohol dehydrogenase (NADP+)